MKKLLLSILLVTTVSLAGCGFSGCGSCCNSCVSDYAVNCCGANGWY